jgi:RHS repeat-associated protein
VDRSGDARQAPTRLLAQPALNSRLPFRPHPAQGFGVVQGSQSGFSFLAAAPVPVRRNLGEGGSTAAALPTSPLNTRTRGFSQPSSGRSSRLGRRGHTLATGCRAYACKTASGRVKWLTRDPIQERGGINLYGFVLNDPADQVDGFGLDIQFCADEDQKFKDWVGRCICELRKTSVGAMMLAMVEETPGVRICSTRGNTGQIPDETRRTVGEIRMNPENPNAIANMCNAPRSERPPNTIQGCAAVLGHELGHVTGQPAAGTRTDLEQEPRAVELIENPIRKELELKCRRTYYGTRVPNTW